MIKTSQSVRILNNPDSVADAPMSGLYLEIQRGHTQFPRRPVRTGRFLIGNGVGCDLRLGGADVPPLHSIVHHEDGIFRLESVAETPLPILEVNHAPVTSVVLSDGDHVRIGPIEFVARFAYPERSAAAASRSGASSTTEFTEIDSEDEFDPEALGELSAEQLVDLIDREQTAVDEFDARRELGGRGLLHTVLNRADQHDARELLLNDGIAGSEMEILRRLERAVEQLGRYADAVSTKVDSALAERLQSLAGRVSESEESRGPRSAA